MVIRATWSFNGHEKVVLGNWHRLVVPAVRPVLLPVQGHVPLGNLVADHGQRPVGRLPPVQSRHRAAPLPSQGMGARSKSRARMPEVEIPARASLITTFRSFTVSNALRTAPVLDL